MYFKEDRACPSEVVWDVLLDIAQAPAKKGAGCGQISLTWWEAVCLDIEGRTGSETPFTHRMNSRLRNDDTFLNIELE